MEAAPADADLYEEQAEPEHELATATYGGHEAGPDEAGEAAGGAGVTSLSPQPADAAVAEPAVAGEGSDDTEGARLIALNMALNGTPREETDRYLAENFRLGNRSTLLDEVYASIEG